VLRINCKVFKYSLERGYASKSTQFEVEVKFIGYTHINAPLRHHAVSARFAVVQFYTDMARGSINGDKELPFS